jgi:hypothetical protein
MSVKQGNMAVHKSKSGFGGARMRTINHRPTRRNGSGLFQGRPAANYTASEQAFSTLVEKRLEELLRGELNTLTLLRRYHREPERLGVPSTPPAINCRELRLPVVERILTTMLQFLHNGVGAEGGPIAQSHEPGRLVERQVFSTRFPHILIERIDRYDQASRQPLETEWVAKRIQNQRADVRVNRALDATNLGIELLKMGFNFLR